MLKALDRAGGVPYLVEQAKKNPRAFLALVGRCLPQAPKIEAGDNARVLVIDTGVPETTEARVIDVEPEPRALEG